MPPPAADIVTTTTARMFGVSHPAKRPTTKDNPSAKHEEGRLLEIPKRLQTLLQLRRHLLIPFLRALGTILRRSLRVPTARTVLRRTSLRAVTVHASPPIRRPLPILHTRIAGRTG